MRQTLRSLKSHGFHGAQCNKRIRNDDRHNNVPPILTGKKTAGTALRSSCRYHPICDSSMPQIQRPPRRKNICVLFFHFTQRYRTPSARPWERMTINRLLCATQALTPNYATSSLKQLRAVAFNQRPSHIVCVENHHTHCGET